jgi:hypothetical protein
MVQRLILTWSAFWLLIAGGSIFLLRLVGADHLNNFLITAGYYSFFALFGICFYKNRKAIDLHAPFVKQAMLIGLGALIISTLCLIVNELYPLQQKSYNRIIRDGFYFPLFRFETISTKLADVAFQQVFIFSLIRDLKGLDDDRLDNKKVSLYFSLAFFSIHLPLVFVMGWVAIYFIIASFFAGGVFSYLILNYRYGPSLSFLAHLSFYFFIGIYLRNQ